VVWGALGVPTPPRPASSLVSLLPFLLNTFASVMSLLVLPNFVYFFLSPETDPDSAHRLYWRNWKLSLPYPTTESVPANIHQLCDFNSRISRHFYNRIDLYGLSSTKSPAPSHDLNSPERHQEEYLSFSRNRRCSRIQLSFIPLRRIISSP
jgi:hypothetical protein